MTANLTATPSTTSITNNQPPAARRCGLNKTGICCKESETPHYEDSSIAGPRIDLYFLGQTDNKRVASELAVRSQRVGLRDQYTRTNIVYPDRGRASKEIYHNIVVDIDLDANRARSVTSYTVAHQAPGEQFALIVAGSYEDE